jgi:hypothetical protein
MRGCSAGRDTAQYICSTHVRGTSEGALQRHLAPAHLPQQHQQRGNKAGEEGAQDVVELAGGEAERVPATVGRVSRGAARAL